MKIEQEITERTEKGRHRAGSRGAFPSYLRSLGFLLFNFLLFSSVAFAADQRSLVLVIGAAGESEYGEQFAASADLWKRAATNGGFKISVIGESKNGDDDRADLLGLLTNEVTQAGDELWLVFIGHGTYDGRSAKFNLRGPDISADDLAAALKPCHRPLAVIQCASASGPFLSALSAPGRVIITATKSGYEANATRFGNYFARAAADPAADLDKDGQTSLLEAFLMASRQVDDFYKNAGRMATEHALLDDNGDGLGTPADWFKGVRAIKKAADGKTVDGVRAHQMFLVRSAIEQELSPALRARRDELESQLSALRDRKPQLKEDDYYNQLEKILVEMAKLYEKK
ncbi:MAG TPA: hypothetical protein VG938_10665 [Verrucomicrobiae bacterium]|nr:hypothetical protein [Verrucomicrobiae bacterium]